MKTPIFQFLIILGLISSCTKPPCECDLMDQKEKFLITSGKIISSNSNQTAIEKGKAINLEAAFSPRELEKKLSGYQGKLKVNIPLPDKKKYYHSYEIEVGDKPEKINLIYYFLNYCTKYPIHHNRNNKCEPDAFWMKEVEKLNTMYLTPLETKATSDLGSSTADSKISAQNPPPKSNPDPIPTPSDKNDNLSVMSGVIMSSNEEPLINAKVSYGGNDTFTDKNGKFKILQIPNKEQRIRVSKNGYKSFSDDRHPKEDIVITLKSNQ